jgi:non-ribosomal peptide synthetase component F
MFPLKLIDYLNEFNINTICWVVSALTMISGFDALAIETPKLLRLIAFGGEVFPTVQLQKWRSALPHTRFVNLYGPTEATGMSCYFEVDREFGTDETLPIGRPFKNTDILLLDGEGHAAANGCVGEICIRGTALTLGYWGDFSRTSEAFVQNPFNDKYPELIYKTGDMGKFNEAGELMFISRKDHQIKHMGHRIELGEIEVVAGNLAGVRSVCCVFNDKNNRIILYYTGTRLSAEIAADLKKILPRYMTPHSILQIDEMPFTATGKIDRKSLASP